MLNVSKAFFLRFYSFFSLGLSLALCCGLWLVHREKWPDHGLSITTLAIFCGTYFNAWFCLPSLPASRYLSHYFLGQSLIFAVMAVELNTITPLYFALLPVLSYFFTCFYKDDKRRTLSLMPITVGFFLFLDNIVHFNTQGEFFGMQGVLFIIFSSFVVFCAFFFTFNYDSLFLSKVFALKQKVRQQPDYKKEDRLFFHDIINQTHNLQLFFRHRLTSRTEVKVEELSNLLMEVETLQSLLKGHFGMNHKDLKNQKTHYNVSSLKQRLQYLASSFFKGQFIDYKLEFGGLLQTSIEGSEVIGIDPTILDRIFVNLMKNIVESHTDTATFKVKFDGQCLNIETSNQVFYNWSGEAVADKLKASILTDAYRSKFDSRMGLESIQYLCEQIDGSFDFNIESNRWINSIGLPCKSSQNHSAA